MGGEYRALTVPPTLPYCVVNTTGREFLLACLDAIERTAPAGIEREVLVLDNASEDGSADAVRGLGREIRLIELERREGKAANDTRLLREAAGRYCLLLNEDSELQAGAAEALVEALEAKGEAAVAGAQLLDSERRPVACAWRFPGLGTALAGALFLHRLLTVQSKGERTMRGHTGPTSARLVGAGGGAPGGDLGPGLFVLFHAGDFCKELAAAAARRPATLAA